MSMYNDYNNQNNQGNQDNQVRQQTYIPYQTQQPYGGGYGGGNDSPRRGPKKKGIAGIVIACTLSAALIGGVVGGVGGVALGRSMVPSVNQQTVADAVAAVLPGLLPEQTQGETVTGAQTITSVDAGRTITEIAAKVTPSVVAIESTISQPYNTPFGTFENEGTGSGSGVIISDDGYIVTNNHVVDGAKAATVTLSDGTEYSAQLIGRDPETDIAIIKIDATGLTPAEFGTSDDLQVGDIAIAIGNPLGTLAGSVTQGIISATEREITIDNTKMNVLQFDAAINQGNSGGALVNDKGQLVGVVNAKSFAVGVEGLGFAIPIDDVREIIDAIVSGTPLGTGIARLGVTTRTVTQEISDMYDVPVGAYVTEVEAFSAAERAGIKVGDVITSFAGQDVTKNEDLSTIRDQHEIGDVLEVMINRNGEEMTLELTLLEGMKTF